MNWPKFNLTSLFNQLLSNTYQYFTGSVVSDGGAAQPSVLPGRANSTVEQHEELEQRAAMNSQAELSGTANSNITQPVFNIHLPSNTGTVIVGDNSSVTYAQGTSCANEDDKQISASVVKLHAFKAEPQDATLNKTKHRRKKRTGEISPNPKVPSIVKKIQEIDKSLTKYRGNGKWLAHAEAIEKLMKEFNPDEDYAEVILYLKYEEGMALFEKRKIDEAQRKISTIVDAMSKIEDNGVAKDINLGKGTDLEKLNDIQQMIYCKCLFLVSKIYCVQTRFGKAAPALQIAKQLLFDHMKDADDLQAQYFLTDASYQYCLNHSSSKNLNLIFEPTTKAEEISAKLKDKKQDNWKNIKRDALLTRCKAIANFCCDGEKKEEFADILKNSLEELEHELWDGISEKQKVAFHVLKSNYFKIHGNFQKASDDAQKGLEIAQECEFMEDVKRLTEYIRNLHTFPEDPVMIDSGALVKKVIGLQSTTDGNLESNAGEFTDDGIFSIDEYDKTTAAAIYLGHAQ